MASRTFIFVIFGFKIILIKGFLPNNVCSTLEAYFDNIATNPNCWYDPEVTATPKERAKLNGFLLEEHTVRTEDGYILPTFRLQNFNGSYGKEVVFIQHGINTDSVCFMVNKENSIPYFLAKHGFDVWLGNYRGCEYCAHERLSDTDRKYWDFSYHEHGLYDLSANIKYIAGKTKRKICYIGHSMGTTGLGIYASMKADEASKYIKYAILLSPVFHMRHTKGVSHVDMATSFYDLLGLLPIMNFNVFMAVGSLEHDTLEYFCFWSLENAKMCLAILKIIIGEFEYQVDYDKLPLIFRTIKNMCFKAFFHYVQAIRTGEFRMFDYGLEGNMIKYNREVPPDYNLTDIKIPMALVYGRTDYLATMEDAKYVYEKYAKPNWTIYGMPHNHLDFLFSSVAKKTFLPLLLRILNKNIK